MKKQINGYFIETCGGFITVKHWIVTLNNEYVGTYFKFGDAKKACELKDFSGAFVGTLY